MSAILIIDTNIWAYYFDGDSPEHKSVVGPVEKALKSEQIAINTIIIMELAHFLIKNLGPVEGGEKLGLFLRFPLAISDFEYRSALDAVDAQEILASRHRWQRRDGPGADEQGKGEEDNDPR